MGWKLTAVLAVALALVALGWLARPVAPPSPTDSGNSVRVVEQQAPAQSVQPDPQPTASASAPAAAPMIADDPSVAAGLPREEMMPAALYRRLRSERPDPAWTPRMESSIRAALSAIPNIDGMGRPPSVVCGQTMCEIHGATRSGPSMDDANAAMQALQGGALRRQLEREGLEISAANFGTDFTLYAMRKAS